MRAGRLYFIRWLAAVFINEQSECLHFFILILPLLSYDKRDFFVSLTGYV